MWKGIQIWIFSTFCVRLWFKNQNLTRNRMDLSNHNSRFRKCNSQEHVVRKHNTHQKTIMLSSIFETDFVNVFCFNFLSRHQSKTQKTKKDLCEKACFYHPHFRNNCCIVVITTKTENADFWNCQVMVENCSSSPLSKTNRTADLVISCEIKAKKDGIRNKWILTIFVELFSCLCVKNCSSSSHSKLQNLKKSKMDSSVQNSRFYSQSLGEKYVRKALKNLVVVDFWKFLKMSTYWILFMEPSLKMNQK